MRRPRDIGRAPVPKQTDRAGTGPVERPATGPAETDRAETAGPAVGRAAIGRARGVAPTPDRAGTEVVPLGTEPGPPVFVDSSGRRRRRLRRLTYLIGFAVLVALVVLWLSQLGDPVRPEPVPPCPAASAGNQATTGPCARR
jgi:hypothetical protein